ncbi:efflux RND transporter periplasmic adaptor subunit [Bosea caraganae]|uniref:Efflux RND transporter periplasmic adaptor subunit n=2 Tax=Bosea caraganae TaxID=2763117 RepID=A0A370L3L3_9HYPH|nr:efflux RND transporter periplasmic adaptor subunit [Bosea caraganae]RDJ28718.1 efflux RND transporter periplasmic adaptor subunit [Bosea caraganae]
MRGIRMKLRLLVSAAAMALALGACNERQAAAPPAAPPPPAVGVQPAAKKGVTWTYSFVGRIKAIENVALMARVQGFLDKVQFTEGQDVKTGDVLYQIEKIQYQAQVDQAQANLAAAKAQELNAQLTYTRSQDLVKTQAVSQATLDSNRANLDIAHASVLQNQAALTQAKENLGYTDVISPINGRIGRTTYTQGNLVGPTSGTLATIVSQDPMYVLFQVSVRQLEEIREARKQEDGSQLKIAITVRLPTGKEYAHPGVWNYTDPQVDQQTDTLTMRATLPNPERQLIDGEFVSVEVRERQEQPRLVVPQAAIQVDQAGSYVMVVDKDNKVQQRRIKLGPQQGSDIVAESGIEEGENIIVDGLLKVRPGLIVSATPVTPASGS